MMKSIDSKILGDLIDLADGHQKRDEYVDGSYDWKPGACAIGCTIRDAKHLKILPEGVQSGDHKSLEKLGVPELAWRLCDRVFENLPREKQVVWTPRFLRAIQPGADYSHLADRIVIRLLEKLAEDAIRADVGESCKVTAALYARRANGDEPADSEWDAAGQQAYAAWQQANAACQQANAACQQANAACQQADAAGQQFYEWIGEMLLEEM